MPAGYVDDLRDLTHPFGVTHTGVTSAAVLDRARTALRERVASGYADTMQFTFRNPERSTDPTAAVPGARAVFVAARPYLLADDDGHDSGTAPPSQPGSVPGRIARYAQLDHYEVLRTALWAVTRRLRDDGWRAVPFADDNSIVDREVAHRAGLGWFGKNANLLISGAGSWFVLGCVVTTAPLEPSTEVVPDGCGPCTRCIDGCPTGAIVAPGVIDARRCLAWVLQRPGSIPDELRSAIGNRIYGCDDCQEVCPPTVHLGARHRVAADGGVRRMVDALEFLRLGDDELLAAWGRWYLADRDPRWVRRNALVVVGNTGQVDDPDVRETLDRYVHADDPLLREHAQWALAQIATRAGSR